MSRGPFFIGVLTVSLWIVTCIDVHDPRDAKLFPLVVGFLLMQIGIYFRRPVIMMEVHVVDGQEIGRREVPEGSQP